MKRLTACILAVALMAALVGCTGRQQAKEPDVIKLGALAPLSGAAAATGQDMRDGFTLALEQVNAKGGILGKKVELLLEDDKGDPATAIAAFEKLVTKDQVFMILGGMSSSITLALAEPAKRLQVIMAWTGAAATKVEQAFAGQDWFFHYHPWEYHNLRATVDFWTHIGAKRIAIAYEDGVFGTGGKDLALVLIKEAGMEAVAVESFKTGSADLSPLLTSIKKSNPDVFYWIGYAADCIPMVTQAKELDFNPKLIYGVPPSWAPGFEKLPESEYVAGLTFWTPDIKTPESQAFVDAYVKRFGHKPASYWAPLAYTCLITVADAINRAGKLDKDAVIKALEQTDYVAPVGHRLRFSPSKYIKHQGFTQWLSFQWRNGKMEVVFPEQLATAPLVYPVPTWKERK